jgi:hypothetical protein
MFLLLKVQIGYLLKPEPKLQLRKLDLSCHKIEPFTIFRFLLAIRFLFSINRFPWLTVKGKSRVNGEM